MSTWAIPSYAEWAVPGYAEDKLLGHGVSGRVVSAVSESTGQRVAIKYLNGNLLRDNEFLAAYRAEAEQLTSLDAAHVVRVFDFAEQPGQGAALVMELIEGVSLRQMIARTEAPEKVIAALRAVGDDASPLLRLEVVMPALASLERHRGTRPKIGRASCRERV